MQNLTTEQRDVLASDPELFEEYKRLQELEGGIDDLRKQQGAAAFLESDWIRKPFPKQQVYYHCTTPLAMFSGAQGSGKTKINMDVAAQVALRRHPDLSPLMTTETVDMWIVGLSYQKVDQVLIPYFRKSLPAGRIKSFDQKSYVMKILADDGSITTVGFMSCDSDTEKFQSNRLNIVFYDEAPTKARGVKIFRESLSRFKPGQTLFIRLAGTPWDLSRFFRDTFYVGAQLDPKTVTCIIVGLADNPYVPREQVAYQATKYVGKELRARIYGEFVALTGLVFDTFDYNVHVIDDFVIPDSWPKYCGIDPTEGRRAWKINYTAINPEGWHYVYKELKIAGTYEIIVEAINSKEAFDIIQYRAIDPFASKFNMATGTSWISDLSRLGLQTRKVDRSKRNMNRSYIAQLLGDPSVGINPKLYFFRDAAAETAQSFMNHEWGEHVIGNEDKQEKETEADDEWKDFVDALMYCMSFKPRFFNVEDYIAKKRMRHLRPARQGLDPTFGY